MSYSIEWHPQAFKFLENLPVDIAERILKKLDTVKEEPFRFLEHFEGEHYKLRVVFIMECFTVYADEIEGRIDPFYYKPEFRELEKNLSKLKHERLGEVIEFSSETWNQKDFFDITDLVTAKNIFEKEHKINYEDVIIVITGATNKHLSPDDVEKIKIPLPPLSVQNKIAEEVKARMRKAEQLQKEAKEELEKAKQEVDRIILGEK